MENPQKEVIRSGVSGEKFTLSQTGDQGLLKMRLKIQLETLVKVTGLSIYS